MLIGVRIDGEDLEQVASRLGKLSESLSSFKPVFEKLGDEFYQIEKEHFAEEGRESKWPRLSARYEVRKRKLYGDKTILRATDTMYRSFTVQGAPFNINRITDTEAEFGSDDPKAIYHQSTEPRTKIPRRPPIDVTAGDIARYTDVASRGFAEMVEAAGFEVI